MAQPIGVRAGQDSSLAIEATGELAPVRVAGLGQPGSASLPGEDIRPQ